MDKTLARVLIGAALLGFLVVTPCIAHAQAALEPTQIEIGAPAQWNLGGSITVQAVLADSQGRPISKEIIYFTTPASFLGDQSDVVVAQAMTNSKGQAVAEFVADTSGPIAVSAEFRGNAQYAPSNATIQPDVAGEQQVYVDHVGVDLPGFNVPPVSAPRAGIQSSQGIAGFIQSLWPAMNGWPVAAVLLLVWSMYLFAVTFVFRVAALGNEPGDSARSNPGRPL